jgi:hypothetical protein
MVFNRKGSFFLNLDEKAAEQSVTVAPIAEKPAKAPVEAKAAVELKASAAAAPAETAPAATGSMQTTAEAIRPRVCDRRRRPADASPPRWRQPRRLPQHGQRHVWQEVRLRL